MRFAVTVVAAGFLLSTVAFAQSGWDKTYALSSKPNLQLDVDDAGVQVRSCGTCTSVHIHVDLHGQDLNRWRITDLQGGSGIRFAMKHKDDRSFFGMGWHSQSPEVLVEAPAVSDLSIRSANGALATTGLHGTLDLKTSNGAISTDQTAGPLRVSTSNGAVRVHSAEGTLVATTSNGAMDLQGRFSQLEADTSEGAVSVQLLPGSNLQSSSRVTTSDGSITMSVPRDLRSDVQISTTNGAIADGLPLQNSVKDQNNLRGTMNGGGPTLRVRTTNGSIAMNTR